MRRVSALATMSLLAVFATGAAARPAAPPTLSGEAFHDGNPIFTLASCPGQSGTFEARGTATGPYPGTFEETGSVDFARIPALMASFTIDSSVGRVTGTTRGAEMYGACSVDLSVFVFHTQPGFNAANTYDATIVSASGASLADNGLFQVGFQKGTSTPGFDQSFQSAVTPPKPPLPTSKAQCKNGGWRNYPQFKNQGQCVSFVETGR